MKSFFTFLPATLLLFCSQLLSAQTQVWATSFNFNDNVDNVEVLAQINADIPQAGKVLVQLDGTCISSVGDRIILAASNIPDWGVYSGSIATEANPNQSEHSFSHSRVYDVNPGVQSFYGVVHRYVETSGNGSAHVVGTLSVKFFPNGSDMSLHGLAIEQTNINLRGNPVVLGQLDINPSMSGTAIVRFNGECISSAGDRIVLAASYMPDWSVNDGNVRVEAIDGDYNSNSFSHTRAYNISPGNHTFYAVAENYAETNGDGIASIYGTLTVEFIPDMYQQDVIPAFTGISGFFDFSANTEIASVNINAPENGTVIVTFDGTANQPDGFLLLGASNEPLLNTFGVGASAYDSDVNWFPFSHSQAYSVTPGNHTFYATGEPYGGSTTFIYGSLTATFVSDDVNVQTEEIEQLVASIEVFPNPTADYAYVKLGETENISLLQLLDAEGKVLQHFDAEAALQNKQLSIDLQALPAGSYFLQILTQEGISISKCITRK